MTEERHDNPLLTDEQEARRLLVAIPLPADGPLNDDQRQAIIATLVNYMARYGLNQRDVSLNVRGMSPSTLSSILGGKYEHPEKIDVHLRNLNAFMEVDARRREGVRAKKPLTTTFVVRLVRTAVDLCIQNASMGYVTGPAGIGKTITLAELERTHPGVIRVNVTGDNAPRRRMERSICMALRIAGRTKRKDLQGLSNFERIVKALRGSHRLLVMDDAHKLPVVTLEMLREIHDECGIGILLIGDVDLAERIHSTTDDDHGQLESRFGIRLDVRQALYNDKTGRSRPLFSTEEIREIFTVPGLRLVDNAIAYLRILVNRYGDGGIRAAEFVVALAARAVRKREKLSSLQRAKVSERDLAMVVQQSKSLRYSDIYEICLRECAEAEGPTEATA